MKESARRADGPRVLQCGCRFIEPDPHTIEWVYYCDQCADAVARMTVVTRKVKFEGVVWPVVEFHFRK